MPAKPKISPEQRKRWLKSYSEGASQVEIAGTDKVARRTVREGIERARIEADFEIAQQEQLREAVRGHQNDLLVQVERIRRATHLPSIDPQIHHVLPEPWIVDSDEDSAAGEMASMDEVIDPEPWSSSTGSSDTDNLPITHIGRSGNGPRSITLSDESSLIWTALKAHTGAKDPLWRFFARWKQARLKEEQTSWTLTLAIKDLAKHEFTLPVLSGARNQPRIAPHLISLVRDSWIGASLGKSIRDLSEELEWEGHNLIHTRSRITLVARTEPDEVTQKQFKTLMEKAMNLAELKNEAEAFLALESATRKVHEQCEQYRLLHFIAGRCAICKKLGGQ